MHVCRGGSGGEQMAEILVSVGKKRTKPTETYYIRDTVTSYIKCVID